QNALSDPGAFPRTHRASDLMRLNARFFRIRYREMHELHTGLYEPHAQPADELLVKQWRSSWHMAWTGKFEIPGTELLDYSLLLGRVSEACLHFAVADDVFAHLVQRTLDQQTWITDPAGILITAGEF